MVVVVINIHFSVFLVNECVKTVDPYSNCYNYLVGKYVNIYIFSKL